MDRRNLCTTKAPAAVGPYAQGVSASGRLLFVSGQLPIDPDTGVMPASIEEQTRRSLENVLAVLEAGGATKEQVVKTTVFLKDMNDFAAMNGIYAEYFGTVLPARAAVQVARLPKDASVEIEAIAVL